MGIQRSIFWRQLQALSLKNLFVFRNYWKTNILRALIFPIAYGIFLAYCPSFFGKPDNLGLGTTTPLLRLDQTFDGSRPLVWADNTNGTGFISATDIMAHLSTNFTSKQRKGLRQVKDSLAVSDACLLNFSGASNCFITVTFDVIPTTSADDTSSVKYTIRTDDGINHIDVKKHNSDLETKLLPLQWGIDQAIIELSTGQTLPQPSYLPYTYDVDQNNFDDKRLLFLSLVGSFCGLAFLLAFVGIIYQLAGGVASERASLLTSHMRVMGALDSARIISWHISASILFLPSWIVLACVWHSRLLIRTNLGLIFAIHLLTGLSFASWAFFVSVPFSKSPQLAAVVATVGAIVLGVIPLGLDPLLGNTTPAILSFFFPPMFYVFALKAIAGFELFETGAVVSAMDPQSGLILQPMIIATVFAILIWPASAVLWERATYKISNPSDSGLWFSKSLSSNTTSNSKDSGFAIRVRNVRKTFNNSLFRRKSKEVVAIADLSIDIPTYGITVLLGPNGAGKSTILSIISGLASASNGTIAFEGNAERPPRGTLGIVPQKNVLFSELTCLQNLRVWNAVKAPDGSYSSADLEQLVRDCDLQSKMHEAAGTLSGGQKRKLQLAIGLVGGSKVILVDECTSGVDPLSRRALWKTLTTYRNERTIVLTTHFLDEADFLADRIAVLAAPGKLVACDTPVTLKSTMGEGYSISVKFGPVEHPVNVLQALQAILGNVSYTHIDDHVFHYQLKTRDTTLVAKAARLIENSEFGILSYEVLGTTIEDIFLDILAQDENSIGPRKKDEKEKDKNDKDTRSPLSDLVLSSGHRCTPLAQATTIFRKRALILRRSWFAPLAAMFIGIAGAWWPIRFVDGGVTSCAHKPFVEYAEALYPPLLSNGSIWLSPPSILPLLNASLPELFTFPSYYVSDSNSTFDPFKTIADENTLIDTIDENVQQFGTQGGIAMDLDNKEILVAFELSFQNFGLFSIPSNFFWNLALNSTDPGLPNKRRIVSSVARLPDMSSEGLVTLQWLSVFGAAMALFPSFFAIYIAKERHSSVQAMHLSNGLSNPLGLWMGHLLFDSIFSVVVATVIVIVYSTVRTKFQAVGLLWLVICLYGWAGTLVAYITAIIVKSPLGAFAVAFMVQFTVFLLYLAGYIITLYSALAPDVPKVMNTLHFTLALVAPINSLARAGFAAVNQFSILCDGETLATGADLVSMTRYGGPILYLVVWIVVLLLVLAQLDSGFIRLFWSRQTIKRADTMSEKKGTMNPDVLAEAQYAALPSTTDPLRVLNVSKTFGSNKAVEDVSFTIPHNSIFVLLGPNGAGKTTTLDMIVGHLKPDSGDIKVNETSIYHNLQKARISFGVCPQFTAIDAHLTVREHLIIYGRLRGLGANVLKRDVDSLLEAIGLDTYADRLATKLSGGNQRKLALSIALIGNPSVILVDEYSTGIDAKMKRELWAVLKKVTTDKAVLLTTHSMEEASYLATKVGIMSKRMLAIGTPEELESRSESYEVHFSCRSREDLVKVQSVMARLPGSRMVDDVATRFEVPVGGAMGGKTVNNGVTSVAGIFEILAQEEAFPEFAVGKSTLETAFIKVINDNAANDDEHQFVDGQNKRRLWGLC